jgi:Tfp pilus assembly protein PilN
MAKSLTNVNHRSPKWYRKSKRIIGLLSGPTVMAVFQIFHLTDKQMANVATIIAFLPTLLEVFSALLANEEYDIIEPKAGE